MSSCPLSTLLLSRSIKSSLTEAGYHNSDDLGGIGPDDLASELGITLQQADNILQQISTIEHCRAGPSSDGISDSQLPSRTSRIKPYTAADLLETASYIRFSTFSSSLDALIANFTPDASYANGGPQIAGEEQSAGARRNVLQTGHIIPGMTIEISGPPGGGKTALAIGIAISARIKSLQGVGGGPPDDLHDVLIIDTEGGVSAERILLAAGSAIQNTSLSAWAVIRGIRLMRIATQVQMVAFLLSMEQWLNDYPKTKLVVIDTLSFHFRNPHLDGKLKCRYMDLAKQAFARATAGRQCAVIVTNQLATKLLTANNEPANFDTGDHAVLMPQLGEAWTTAETIRIVIFRGGTGEELRFAHAGTSGMSKDLPWAPFDIDVDGLPCDILYAGV